VDCIHKLCTMTTFSRRPWPVLAAILLVVASAAVADTRTDEGAGVPPHPKLDHGSRDAVGHPPAVGSAVMVERPPQGQLLPHTAGSRLCGRHASFTDRDPSARDC